MKFVCVSLLVAVPLFAAEGDRKNDDIKRIEAATTTLIDIQHAKDGGIPHDFLEKARCVGVVPATKNIGFILGAQYGKGIVTCRVNNSNRWSAPAMMVLEAGSVGWQAGVAETDIVFAVMNRHAEERLESQKVVLGADAMGAAGPIGRSVSADTNAWMRDEILTWSRARGVFAGVDLKGGSMRLDKDDNEALYGPNVTFASILDGKVPTPPSARALHRELERYAPRQTHSGD